MIVRCGGCGRGLRGRRRCLIGIGLGSKICVDSSSHIPLIGNQILKSSFNGVNASDFLERAEQFVHRSKSFRLTLLENVATKLAVRRQFHQDPWKKEQVDLTKTDAIT